jgi:histidinol dehydrogenase
MSAAPPPVRRLDTRDAGFEQAFVPLLATDTEIDPGVESTVAAILDDVRARGDPAVLDYTARFDRLKAASVSALVL